METVEFIEETHQYLVNGVLVPSVTQILNQVFPDKYGGIPQKILDEKSVYGTELHKYIEVIERKKPRRPLVYIKRYFSPNIYQEESLKEYLRIKQEFNIEVLEVEKIVFYKNLYGGTLDIKALVNGKKAIIDVKTTAELDRDYVAWQTSYYELADEEVEEHYCLWLPKGHLGKLEKVERIEKNLLLEVANNYESI